MLTIPEKSRLGLAFIFEDEDLRAFTPGTVRYRLHDPYRDREIIAWTSADPDSTINVIIPASANAIYDDTQAYEMRIVTVQSDYDTDDQLSAERVYRVQNLSGFR